MRLLVFRGGALGDGLVTFPALQALRAAGVTHLTLVGHRPAARLAQAAGVVDEGFDQNDARWVPLWSDGPLPAELSRWLSGFDRVLNYTPDPDGVLAQRFASWGERYLSASGPVDGAGPAAHQLLAPLLTAGWARATELAPILDSGPGWHEAARARFPREGSLALHPGSGSTRKNWPLASWQELAIQLGRPVLWITGEADAAAARPPPGVSACLAHDWPLPLLAAALARCSYYLGHDTGISHLAALAGPPGLLLFGPSDAATWAPPTARLRVLVAPERDLTALSVDAVLAAVRLPARA